MSDLRDLADRLENQAQNVDDRSDSNLPEDYERGISAGIRYAKDELEEWLDENEERYENARVISEPWGARKGGETDE